MLRALYHTFVFFLAFVSQPALGMKLFEYSDQKSKILKQVQDDEKGRLNDKKPAMAFTLAGKPYVLKDLPTINHGQLRTLSLVQLTLSNHMRSLNLPINIAGRLEISREGNSVTPFTVTSNLFAGKGVFFAMPNTALRIGKDMVKIQANDGMVDLRVESLDICKAQVFGRTGMHLEVTQEPITIGRSVEGLTVLHCWFDEQGGYISDREIRPNDPLSLIKPYLTSPLTEFDTTLPYHRPNGTFLITEGPMTMVAPDGVQNNQADIYVRGGDLTIKGQGVVHNLAGKIFVNGHAHLSDLTLRNSILTGTSPYYHSFIQGMSSTQPTSQRAEVTVNGNLTTKTLNTLGSFVHVGGTLTELQLGKKEDFIPTITVQGTVYPVNLRPAYPNLLSVGKGAILSNGHDVVLEGVVQSPEVKIEVKGNGRVGRALNYRRPAIKAFQHVRDFDLDRQSPLYIPNTKPHAPWLHQPAVDLLWDITLPPAVAIGPNGLYLVGKDDQFLYHPLQESDALPATWGHQLQRGYLNVKDHYISGRYAAYDLYVKLKPKALSAPEDPRALVPLSDSKTVKALEEITFAVFYRGACADGKTVYTPVSWVSSKYDHPRLRNPDGGIFADQLTIDIAPKSKLTVLSTLHGDHDLHLTGNALEVRRQDHTWQTFHMNVTKKKRLFGCSENIDIVTVNHAEPQMNTGIVSTGKDGHATLELDQFDQLNGADLHVGKGGLEVDIRHATFGCGVHRTLGYSESRSGRNSASRYFSVPTIRPATVESTGGIKGTFGTVTLEASNLIALEQDIDLAVGGDANLLAHKETQSLGVSVRKDRGTVTISEGTTEVGLPSSIIALNGNVRLKIGGKLRGEAPQYYVKKKIDVTSKSMHVAAKPLDTKTHSKTIGFPSFTSYINETVREHHQSALFPTIVSGEGATFLTTDGDAYLQAPLLSGDYTQKAMGGDSIIDSVLLDHFIEMEQDSFSFSNLALDLTQSAVKADFAQTFRTLHTQFPLLTTVKNLAHAHDGADGAEGAVKTAYQSYQLLSELNGAGSLNEFAKNRLTRVGFGASSSTTNSYFTTAAVPHMLTPSAIILESEDGEARAVGLSGTLSNLIVRGRTGVTLDAPKEQGSSSSTSEDIDVSIGFSKKGFSVSMGHADSQAQSQFTRYAHQPLTILGTTTFESDANIHINTPFTTAHSCINGRQIHATTMQDSYTSSQSSSHTSLGFAVGPTGVTPSGGVNGAAGHSSRHTALHPTVITSTQESDIRAREKVVLRGATFLTQGSGTYATPVTEAYDLVDKTETQSNRFGVEFSASGAVPGFAEFGSESTSQSDTHRATIGSHYRIVGRTGSANRNEDQRFIKGPRESTHIWFGAPIVTNSVEAINDMRGGLHVLGDAFTPTSIPASTNTLPDEMIEVLADLAAEQNIDPATFVEDVVNEVITQNTREDTIDLIVDEHFAQHPKDHEMLLWDVGKDGRTQPQASDYKAYVHNIATFIDDILFDLAQERQYIIRDTQEKVMRKTRRMTVGKLSELIGLTVIGTLNEFVDSFSWFPGPAGLISSVGAAGRDIISEKTTVKDYALESAFGIGLLKGVGYTVKGLKSVYKKSASFFKKGEKTIIKPANSDRPYLPFTHHTKANVPMQHQKVFKKWTTGTISDDLVLTPSYGYEMLRSKFTVDSKGPFNVLAHGNPHQLYVHSKDIHPKALSQDNLVLLQVNGHVALDEVQAARLIRTAPGYVKGQPINLMACKAGELSYGFAQRLADRINVPVSAFTTNVQLLKGGDFTSVNRETYEIGILRTFYPKK